MAESIAQQLDLLKHELDSLKPERNDYATACLAITFAITEWERYREFVAVSGMEPPMREVLTALVRMDESYCNG